MSLPRATVALSTLAAAVLGPWHSLAQEVTPEPAAEAAEYFELHVRPLLVEQCFRCHGDVRQKSQLRLDSRAAVLAGGKRGPAAIEGRPEESLLVRAIGRAGELKMPPGEPLAEAERATLARWIELGLPWPETKPTTGVGERDFTDEERAFWSFQPLADPAAPAVRDESWPQSDLDRFILAELEAKGLSPAPPADKRTLIRRATFDLIGLPPTPEEVAAFVADESPDAFATVVDRLLASPHYGERWARHWLDVVRYTDSFDSRLLVRADDPKDVSEAWRYRDWVVDAINADLPFAEFVQDQIAGDLRASDADAFDPARVVATGMLAIGEWGGGDSDKEKLLTDIADDQVNVVGRAFLGLTLACARCHDHKFDPITQGDYYGLAGVFFSSHILPDVGPKTDGPPMLRIPLASADELAARARHEARVAEFTAKLAAVLGGAPFTTFAPDVAGIAGVVALRGAADTPSLTVNANERIVAFSTVTLPARSVAVHPSPGAGVAAAWSCPLDTTIVVTGRVADGDAVCGDGFEWTLERKSSAGVEILARGEVDNGQAMELAAGSGGERLAALTVARGDELRLTVLPRAEYTCDTTVVEWNVAEAAGAHAWNLTGDVLAAVSAGGLPNPLPAADGATWRFLDRSSASLATVDSPELAELRAAAPPPLQFAVGIAEGGVPNSPHAGVHDVAMHERGRYDRLGARVPRRFPRILAGDAPPPIPGGSGRRELAAWIASPGNALAVRVFVNRVWQRHFGAGLVRTSGDFGTRGERPTHPELLDWLARRFLESGGSLKALHRELLLTSTWQQSSVPAPATLAADPDNRLLGRMPRMRLDAEQLRDALLAAAGELDLARGGPASRDPATKRRALYVMTVRSDRSSYRALFDAADPAAVVDARIETTVAPQALWLLNDDFALDRAAALARRVARETEAVGSAGDAVRLGDADAQIERLYALVFTRRPRPEESSIARGLLARGSLEELAHVLLCSNEFMFVD